MGGLLHLVQRGGTCMGGLRPRLSPPRCTKCNSPPINGQCHCTNFIIIRCGTDIHVGELASDSCTSLSPCQWCEVSRRVLVSTVSTEYFQWMFWCWSWRSLCRSWSRDDYFARLVSRAR